MAKVYVRVDDRLIHGQIVTAWCSTLKIQEIIAIDDNLASNPMMKAIMTLGVSSQYSPKVVTSEEAKKILKTVTNKNRLVITRFGRNLLEIQEEILNSEHINIGNCSKQEGAKYNIRGIGISQVLSFTEEDKIAFDRLSEVGIKIICQALPQDKKRTWEELKAEF
ncbi:MAG: PTS system mannose/fructose/N-acetylgalactosamine-transporter subunit IIB [Clostridiaceae bacterium]